MVSGIETVPSSDELKHFGAAMASFGSVALFHLPGITPEALKAELAAGKGDGEILEWVKETAPQRRWPG